jgi:teichuronic acid biosynthesis glycosyltransferase TuaG
MKLSQMDLVSIITPAYNAANYIEETLDSVLAQSYKNWELLVVDDYSTDQTADIVNSYCEKDQRVKLHRLPKNMGCAFARNYATKNSKGKYIAFLDSDDLWLPDKLSIQLEYMIQNDVVACHSSYLKLYQNTTTTKSIIALKKIDFNRMLMGNPIGCLTFVYDCSKIGKYYFDGRYKISEDYATWIDISREHTIYGIEKILAIYRVHNQGKSIKKYRPAIDTWRILYSKENMGFLTSLYCFTLYIINYIKKEFDI